MRDSIFGKITRNLFYCALCVMFVSCNSPDNSAREISGKNNGKPQSIAKKSDVRTLRELSRQQGQKKTVKTDKKKASVSGTNSFAKPGGLITAGESARMFKAKTVEGADINLESFKGKIILLDFWATWCAPCRRELPYLSKLSAEYKNSDKVAIIGISLDKNADSVRQFVKKYKLNYPIVYDGRGWRNQVAEMYGVRSIPFTVIIGTDGKVVKTRLRGERLIETIRKMAG